MPPEAFAVSSVDDPAQKEAAPLMEAVGVGFTTTFTEPGKLVAAQFASLIAVGALFTPASNRWFRTINEARHRS